MGDSATARKPKQTARSGARPARVRLSAAERRAQLIDVAIPLFGEHGFAGTTTKAIARAANVSEAIIFRHFQSKEELYAAAFDRWRGKNADQFVGMLQGYADRGDDLGLLKTLYTAMLQGYEQDRSLHRMVLYAGLERGTSGHGRITDNMQHMPVYDFLERYIRQRQEEGAFRSGDPYLIVTAVLGLPQSHALWTKLSAFPSAHSDHVVADLYARMLLQGLRA